MPYTIQEEKTFAVSRQALIKAALGAIAGLEGEVLKQDADSGRIVAKFKKTILGKVLGDRSQLELDFESLTPDESRLEMTIFPINPIGQPLQFGARKGVSRTVLTWFIAHVEHRLK